MIAYLSIGTNTNHRANIEAALNLLRQQVTVTAVSDIHEFADHRGGALVYWNLAVAIETDLTQEALKRDVLRQIERTLGRDRSSELVTIDLDIVMFDGKSTPDIELDHVAIPLAEIMPSS
ncbi:MAG: hypothetical protein CUN56_00800 [Phototrophicales bacterium]|nr:MAG: hypothetical protein CUN56_00800 [Phototrophicales bacterium]RMG76707.1 MAG: 2-amino-4-hydroxy-6-hydroxymethyldihydropteridine diphosphokinase [Chloroflexota bacterium]